MRLHEETVANVGPKIAGVWVAWGFSSWSEVAGFLAAILSALALSEWLWKKLFRPMCVYAGWLQPRKRRELDREEDPDE